MVVPFKKASVSTFDMGPDPSESLPSILASLPTRLLGNKVFVISKEASIASIQQKVEMAGLMNLHTQWLYLVTDSTEKSEIVPEQIKQAQDGYNLAFLYNASASNIDECRVCLPLHF